MIHPAYLADSFQRNIRVLKMQTQGLTHEQSLTKLPFRGNCMNWIVGHLVNNRNNVLRLLGASELIEEIDLKPYQRESDPLGPESEGILGLDTLLDLLDHAQDHIARLLEEIPEQDLQSKIAFFGNTEMTVAEWLLFFLFHDTYHTGQTEILRQAAGMDDKVI
jgi:hypothetical protein